jgi:hypothetical protein
MYRFEAKFQKKMKAEQEYYEQRYAGEYGTSNSSTAP